MISHNLLVFMCEIKQRCGVVIKNLMTNWLKFVMEFFLFVFLLYYNISAYF